MKTLTYNEIIKALECCTSRDCSDNVESTRDCPLKNDEHCACTLPQYALNLINRQKTEIERLTKANEIFAGRNTLDKIDEILELKSKGYTIRYIAKKVGYCERHIYRILKQRKDEGK